MSSGDKSEPTMDEILASIRRIIADDSEPDAVVAGQAPGPAPSGNPGGPASGLSSVIGAGAPQSGPAGSLDAQPSSSAPQEPTSDPVAPPVAVAPMPPSSAPSQRATTSVDEETIGLEPTSMTAGTGLDDGADALLSATGTSDSLVDDVVQAAESLAAELEADDADVSPDFAAASLGRSESSSERGSSSRDRSGTPSRREPREVPRRRSAPRRSGRDDFPELPDSAFSDADENDLRLDRSDSPVARNGGGDSLDDDALELTEVVTEDGSVVSLSEARARARPARATPDRPERPSRNARQPDSRSAPDASTGAGQSSDAAQTKAAVGSSTAAGAEQGSADAFAQLRQAVRSRKERSAPPPPRPASVAGSLTVEQLVSEAVKPLLQEWLEQNLRGIVEEMVADEIRRVTSERIED